MRTATRVLLFLAAVAALVAAAVWVADRPGYVAIEWLGWRIDTSMPVLLLALAAVAGTLIATAQALARLRGLPRRLGESRRERRRRKGYLALGEGFAAIAAGDAARARKLANEVAARLDEPELTLLLTAQAAELAGDAALARTRYAQLKDRPDTELIGLRGLLGQAQRDGDHAQAMDLARRAVGLRPDRDWAVRALFEEQARDARWAEAEATLALNIRAGAFAPNRLDHMQAVVATARAAAALAESDRVEALRLARLALDRDGALVPAAVLAVGLLAADGKDRKAAGVVEETWRRSPHPDLARACFAIWPGDEPLRRAQRADRLAAINPGHAESHLAVAETALDAGLWGQARTNLMLLAEADRTARVCRLMARLEQAEKGDMAAANDWLHRAGEAPPDPGWRCGTCGAQPKAWTACCPACGTFDALAWSAPPRAMVRLAATVPAVTGPDEI